MTNLHSQADHYQPYKRPFVRDLAFALSCPNAITNWQSANVDNPQQTTNPQNIHVHSPTFWQAQFFAYQTRLKELDTTKHYQQLTKFLISRPSPHRLGFHFEGLILFWLQDGFAHNLHPFEVIAHNVQIIDNGQTFGELDLIICNHQTHEVEHWELAIKFYLGSAPYRPIDWVGINSKDNLQRKLDHMANKPFTCSTVNVTGKTITINKRYAIIKGRFFKPYQQGFIPLTWLTKGFPIHNWYAIKQVKPLFSNNNDDNDYIIRQSRYIEWFTQRAFYDDNYSIRMQDVANIKTGLFFNLAKSQLTSDFATPFVIKAD